MTFVRQAWGVLWRYGICEPVCAGHAAERMGRLLDGLGELRHR